MPWGPLFALTAGRALQRPAGRAEPADSPPEEPAPQQAVQEGLAEPADSPPAEPAQQAVQEGLAVQAEPEDSPPEEPAQQAEPADSPQEEVAEAVPGGLLAGSPNLVEHSVRLTPQRGFPSS